MQANIGLQRTGSRSLAGALVFLMAAAALALGAGAGYWARGLSTPAAAPAVHAISNQPALVNPPSQAANERARQRLVEANSFDGSLPTVAAPRVRAPQHS